MGFIRFNNYVINRCISNTHKCSARNFSFDSLKNAFANSFRFQPQPSTPPYSHICQLGDPVLRMKSTPLDLKLIETRKFQTMLDQLRDVMKKYQMSGLSAPQIGIPLQVFAIEIREHYIKLIDPRIREALRMEQVPLTYFINPTMEITNPEQVMFTEMCGSVCGYEADVKRAKGVEIKALNRLGIPFSWKAEGWVARVIQHEIDHLQGILYIDKMEPSTFQCSMWENININKGKVVLKYYAK
ncbi:peptide deformylase, mitochondrial [Megalopta genalis]|uniref:peptide deformylase, mitochondrial n=1 Tax=Megalopta genalis TaxID=115081 RepID=UPI003FD54F06